MLSDNFRKFKMMHKRTNHAVKLLAAVLFLAVFALPFEISLRADEEWSEKYYRAVDLTGEMSKAQRNALDTQCLDFMKAYRLDLALLCTTTERYDDMSMEELARGFFESNEFGYGQSKDGFAVVYDGENGDAVVVPMGNAQSVIEQEYLDFVIREMPKYQQEYGPFGPLYASSRMLSNKMKEITGIDIEDPKGGEEQPDGEDINAEVDAAAKNETGDDADKKEAAPEKEDTDGSKDAGIRGKVLSGYELYAYIEKNPDADATRFETDPETDADESRPRVTDKADLFTDEEESTLEKRLFEIRKELKKDLVVYTDDSSYGKERSVCAADFYDYNGYGCADEYEGACLFICMEEGNRGFWTACLGSETKGAYTEKAANRSDDMLYSYVKDQRYYEGVADWADNMRRILLHGDPFAYDWLEGSMQKTGYDPDTPRVVDDGNLMRVDERKELQSRVRSFSELYGFDVAVHTVYDTLDHSDEDYAGRFYYSHGYGFGDDQSGILINIEDTADSFPNVKITCFGEAAKYDTGVGITRLEDLTEDNIASMGALGGMEFCLKNLESQIKKGRVPRSGLSWALSIVFDLIIGLIVGGIMHSSAKKKMNTPKVETNARPYLVEGSLSVRNIKDVYYDTTTTRKKRYTETRSSSSGSSGRSSYSSSYSGSSGRSHSGSGRSF